jgi:hypothetical protein|tara:strand:- start:9383 stop:9559 length:177 start_codon:yes stop_codon:yes gene_type:complete
MTVKELTEKLSAYPDEMDVQMLVAYSQMYVLEISNVISSDEWDDDDAPKVWLVEEEIE